MKARSLSEIATAVGGRLVGEEDTVVSGVATDNRTVRSGDLFVALVGEREDGHRFVEDAIRRGAAGALVSRIPAVVASVVVADTGAALLELAKSERSEMTGTVVGITGSTGKTSVKDFTASVLTSRYRVWASPRSFNTEVGVPLTLLNAPTDAEVVVVEMGSRGLGHIAALCAVARPHMGVVTNLSLAHMEMFGSLATVADAKAELVEALPETGTAVLNADDLIVRKFDARTPAHVLRYGVALDADVRGEDIALDEAGRPSFTLHGPDGAERVELPVSGEHMAWNALAAAAAGIGLGLSVGECATGLKDVQLSPWRMEVASGQQGIRVLNDAYNANPASMAAALKAARWMAREGRSIAVLGEMAELGQHSAAEHERVGELVARLGIDELIVVGSAASAIATGAEREGVEPDRIIRVDTPEAAAEAVQRVARDGDLVLVKGSRVAGLERVAEALR